MVNGGRGFRVLFGSLFLVGAAAMAQAEPAIGSISPAELAPLLDRGVVVIDVRRADEWRATGLVPGSRTVTAFDAQGQLDPRFADEIRATVAPDREIALICRSGNRSSRAARLLTAQLGYTHVYNVDGGIAEWLREGLPVTPCPTC